jgi:hypothetical protein
MKTVGCGLLVTILLLFANVSCKPEEREEQWRDTETATEAGEDFEYHYNVKDEVNRYVNPSKVSEYEKPKEKITFKEFSSELEELMDVYVTGVFGDIKYNVSSDVLDKNEIYGSARDYLTDPQNYPVIRITADVADPYYYATKIQSALREQGLYATIYVKKER